MASRHAIAFQIYMQFEHPNACSPGAFFTITHHPWIKCCMRLIYSVYPKNYTFLGTDIWSTSQQMYKWAYSVLKWSVDVSVCRRFGLSTFRFVDVLVCRRFGLSTFRFVDVLVCQRFGLSTFWPVTHSTTTTMVHTEIIHVVAMVVCVIPLQPTGWDTCLIVKCHLPVFAPVM